jgi:hypothetical protein
VGVVRACPECGEVGVPLLFGRPIPEAVAAADDGELALGGCLVPEDPVNWQCPQRHRWHDPDETEHEGRVLAALIAHGYTDIDDDL